MHHKILTFRIWSVLGDCLLSISIAFVVGSLFLKTKNYLRFAHEIHASFFHYR